jgi:hypothetical protein
MVISFRGSSRSAFRKPTHLAKLEAETGVKLVRQIRPGDRLS